MAATKEAKNKNIMIIKDQELTITELSLIWNILSTATVYQPINKTIINLNQEQLREFVAESQADEAMLRAKNAATDENDFLIVPEDPKKEYVFTSKGKSELIKATHIAGKEKITIPKLYKFYKNQETLDIYLKSNSVLSFLFPDFSENPNVPLKEIKK